MPERVAFVHLMRTAGSFVDSCLARDVLGPRGYTIHTRAERDWSPAELEGIRTAGDRRAYVHNHAGGWDRDCLARYQQAGWFAFSFFRHPGDQWCSQYRFARKLGGQLALRVTLDEYLRRAFGGGPALAYRRQLELPDYWSQLDFVEEFSEDALARFLQAHFDYEYLPAPRLNATGGRGYNYYFERGDVSPATHRLLLESDQYERYLAALERAGSGAGRRPLDAAAPAAGAQAAGARARADLPGATPEVGGSGPPASRARSALGRGWRRLRGAVTRREQPEGRGVDAPFFIFFLERSGSSHLVSLLASHPSILCRAEVFLTPKEAQASHQGFADAAAIAGYLDALYATPGKRAAGFKLKLEQRDAHPDVWRYLLGRRDEMRLVCLQRKNLLKQALSKENQLRLRRAGLAANLGPGGSPPRERLEVDPQSLLGRMQLLERNRNRLGLAAGAFPRRIDVTYEELLADPQATVGRILDFLGVQRPGPLASRYVKLTPDDLRAAVANLDELRAALLGTPYEVYL